MDENDSGDTSERYEFDAPSQVVDLKELENAKSDDKWFGPNSTTAPPPNSGSPAQNSARPKRRTANQPPAQPCRVSKHKALTSAPAAEPSKKYKKPSSPEYHELERIANLLKKVALLCKKNEASYKSALAGNPPQKKIVLSLTVPKEFHFNTKAATSSNADHKVDFISELRKPSTVKQPSPIKAPPVPHFGLPLQPRLPENHQVEVCPFSFEVRERERRALKGKRLEEMRNEEVPQFKAQPLPNFNTVVLPKKKKLEPIKPEPFRLLLDERGAVKRARWEQMVKEEQKRQEATLFKARTNIVTHKEPFQPRKESWSAVVPKDFELSTERRARERQEYEQVARMRAALRSLEEEQWRREEEVREKKEIAKLRQERVHRAQPIRRYKPVVLKKSDIPLTVPQSLNFSDRFRL